MFFFWCIFQYNQTQIITVLSKYLILIGVLFQLPMAEQIESPEMLVKTVKLKIHTFDSGSNFRWYFPLRFYKSKKSRHVYVKIQENTYCGSGFFFNIAINQKFKLSISKWANPFEYAFSVTFFQLTWRIDFFTINVL